VLRHATSRLKVWRPLSSFLAVAFLTRWRMTMSD
jgi:hypothetical protein